MAHSEGSRNPQLVPGKDPWPDRLQQDCPTLNSGLQAATGTAHRRAGEGPVQLQGQSTAAGAVCKWLSAKDLLKASPKSVTANGCSLFC